MINPNKDWESLVCPKANWEQLCASTQMFPFLILVYITPSFYCKFGFSIVLNHLAREKEIPHVKLSKDKTYIVLVSNGPKFKKCTKIFLGTQTYVFYIQRHSW
jgi:hypothetical protein